MFNACRPLKEGAISKNAKKPGKKNALITAVLSPFPAAVAILKVYVCSIALVEVPTAFKDYNESTSESTGVPMKLKP